MSNKVREFLDNVFGEVKVVVIDNNPYFIAKDICDMLEIKNSRDAVSKLTEGTQKKYLQGKESLVGITDDPNVTQLTLLTEAGLYKLVFKSRKPEAEKFADWVTETVIPAIRKDDGYISGEEDFAKGDMSEDELILKAMTVMQDKITRLKEENESMKPKVRKWDQFLDSNGCYSFTEVSKLISTMANEEETELTLSVMKLTDFLRTEGVLSKSKTPDKENKKGSYKNLPNKDYEGYFNVVSVSTNGGFNKTQTKVKASGVEYIYDLLKEKYKKAE